MKFIWVSILFVATACTESIREKPKENQVEANINSIKICKYNLLSWSRKDVADFGCMLQSEFNFRDSKFNCDLKNYVNHGDPCFKTEAYYEGPSFPKNESQKIDANIESIGLNFEHGELQMIEIDLKNSMQKEVVQKIFSLPINNNDFPQNVMNISYSTSKPNEIKGFAIIGFDHQGAGDVDCDEIKKELKISK